MCLSQFKNFVKNARKFERKRFLQSWKKSVSAIYLVWQKKNRLLNISANNSDRNEMG